jgi:hypothetical protein
VDIDLRNAGTWSECAVVEHNLDPEWVAHAQIYVTASTGDQRLTPPIRSASIIIVSSGQLADNHDVMSLRSFSSYEAMETFEREDSSLSEGARFFRGIEMLSFLDRLAKIETAVSNIIDRISDLDHQLEQGMASVGSTFESIHDKLENQATDITATRYHDDYYGPPGAARADAVARSEMERLQSRVEAIHEKASEPRVDSWRLPFFILLVVLVAGAIGLYMFYLRLRKIHIL